MAVSMGYVSLEPSRWPVKMDAVNVVHQDGLSRWVVWHGLYPFLFFFYPVPHCVCVVFFLVKSYPQSIALFVFEIL